MMEFYTSCIPKMEDYDVNVRVDVVGMRSRKQTGGLRPGRCDSRMGGLSCDGIRNGNGRGRGSPLGDHAMRENQIPIDAHRNGDNSCPTVLGLARWVEVLAAALRPMLVRRWMLGEGLTLIPPVNPQCSGCRRCCRGWKSRGTLVET